ncbi:MAG: hypothetical protein ACI92I_000892 [Acidimicrobiales bacterium]|jgi:hypothetical protein
MQPDENDIIYTQYTPDLAGIFRKLVEILTGNDGLYDTIVAWLTTAWGIFSILSFIVSAILIFGIIYSYIRFNQMSEIETKQLLDAEKRWKELHGDSQENRRWSEIKTHLTSDNPNDWKLAIIEADIILGDVLHDAGYAGLSIGDQLKSASAASFTTLRDAWDAHMIRNDIAHKGTDFVLTQSMAKEAIIKYERVFREFDAL